MRALIARELLQRFRHGSIFGLLMVNALALVVIALVTQLALGSFSPWVTPSIGSTISPQPANVGAVMLAWRGPTLFLTLVMWLLLLLTVVVPGVTASAISGERLDGTLDGLILSGIPASGIVVAKLVACAAHAGLVLLSSAPAFALVWVLGGVPLTAVGATLALVVSHLLILVAVNLVVSALLRRPASAVVAGYAVAALVALVPLVGFAAAVVLSLPEVARAFAALNPIAASLSTFHEFTSHLVKVSPLPETLLPMALETNLAGRSITLPLWSVSLLIDLVVVVVLVAVAAVAIDPLHPLKLTRWRRATDRARSAVLEGAE